VTVRIEHVNVTVADADASAALAERLFGWKIRWAGPSLRGGRTVHVGTAGQYLAFYSPPAGGGAVGWPKGMPLNHVAVEVDDLDAIEREVTAAGLSPFGHDDYEPGRRFYFFDTNGIEFEVVSYAPAPAGAAA
jgi:catechol 2,3-dioxygenase-like lactoylglutathione lyase family enzyme